MNPLPQPMPALDWLSLAETLVHTRQHIGPKHLEAPGPSREQLERLLEAAAAAPDHGQLRPWRFVVIGNGARARLAEAFAQSLLERDPQALPEQLDDARQKAHRGPVLLLAVADLRAVDPDVPEAERLVSLGCAIQNLMLTALAHGFSSGLTSGRAMSSRAFRQAFEIAEGEHAVCCINLGTARKARPRKPRPAPADFVRWMD